MGVFSLGVDVGGTKTLCVLCDPNGNIVARERFASHSGERDPLDVVIEGIQRFIDKSGVPMSDIVGTGIGFPGIIDPTTSQLLNAPGFLSHHKDVQRWLQQYLPTTVSLDNDVNMAVMGEWWMGGAKGSENVALISIGTGIGAGLLVNGKVYRGARGFAGEIGRFQLDPLAVRQSPATLEEFGPFESLASGHGIRNLAQQHYHQFFGTLLREQDLSAEQVFKAAGSGDPLGKFVLSRVFDFIAFSLANLIALLDPDIVLIGGGVSRQGTGFVDEIRRRVAHLMPFPVSLDLALLGEDAGAYGAAVSALRAADVIR